jgi:Cu+-exporting ATPase
VSAPAIDRGATGGDDDAAATGRTDLVLGGMTCGACANRIERKLNKVAGVSATVNYATEKASVTHPAGMSSDDLIAVVEAAGYTAALPPDPGERPDDDGPDPVLREHRTRLLVCAALTVPIVLTAMVPPLQLPYWQWVSLALALPVVVWGAEPFHRAAWTNLRHGAASMDTLVSIGSLAAFGWSLYALLFGDAGAIGYNHPFHLQLGWSDGSSQIYLEVAAGVITFVLAGRYAEAKARRRSGAALRSLLALAARDACVLRDGREVRVPVDELVVGDRFVVRPGEKVPTDGTVLDGRSAVDTSMLTGETVPVDVGSGEPVVGGCVNVTGKITVRATGVGADTQLAQMAAMVERAQTGKAAVQRLADKVSGTFVPGVLVLAAIAGGFWAGAGAGSGVAFSSAVAVLIVACPCALGLATPTALLVGTGRGAQLGILITGPEVLESTRKVDTVVLDKTGTVTTGEMTVTDVVPARGEKLERVLGIAAALESESRHPIAVAITEHGRRELTVLPRVTKPGDLDGLGAQGTVGSRQAVIARPDTLVEAGLRVPAELREALAAAAEQGRTATLLAWSGRARAVLVVADTPRPTSKEAIAQLRALGLEPILLTGDTEAAARTVADEVGIDTVIADARPADKVDVVAGLQAEGRTVAMVGDGVNDAAALAQADLGLAMGTGTDVAMHASDLTLVRADLVAAVDAIRLSRRTLAVIKGNLFWAFAYNYLALPIAAAGLLNPMLAGAAMALSSVFVVSNSLRLRRFQPADRPA